MSAPAPSRKQSWSTLKRETILDTGPFLRVESHHVRLSDGREIDDWPWVITPDYINVVVQTESGAFLCFRQTKYALSGESLAIVGGYIEAGEEPLLAARRELMEETGYESDAWTSLGSYVVDANRGAGRAHFFLARRSRRVNVPNADDLEEQSIVMLSLEELRRASEEGAFEVLPWACCVSLALGALSGGGA